MAPVYLVDHFHYKPPEEYRVRLKDIDRAWSQGMENMVVKGPGSSDSSSSSSSSSSSGGSEGCGQGGEAPRSQEEIEREAMDVITFQYCVFRKAGLSDDGTYLPPAIHPRHCGTQPRTDMASAMEECREALCGAVQGVLSRNGLRPTDIDILVTTCSIFCPTPSISSMLINHFKMRPNIQAYSLGGMGCGNGVVSVSLVRDLLAAHPGANALFCCTETTTPALYRGRDKSRLVTNVLFRMGGSAMLLSNKASWAARAKYQLVKNLRVHMGAREDAYRCIWYGPDREGLPGVSLGLNVVTEATRALTSIMRAVAPHVLTWRQICAFLGHAAATKLAVALGRPKPPPFSPSFAEGVPHFLLHAGGAKVLDGLGQALHLTPHHLEPSRQVLHDYGNVSSSSTWYALGFIETVRGVKAGDKVLQVGVGSGVKCGVNLWRVLRDIDDAHPAWDHCITPERRGVLSAATLRYSWRHAMRRLLFLVVMVVMAVLLWLHLPRHMAGFHLSHNHNSGEGNVGVEGGQGGGHQGASVVIEEL